MFLSDFYVFPFLNCPRNLFYENTLKHYLFFLFEFCNTFFSIKLVLILIQKFEYKILTLFCSLNEACLRVLNSSSDSFLPLFQFFLWQFMKLLQIISPQRNVNVNACSPSALCSVAKRKNSIVKSV